MRCEREQDLALYVEGDLAGRAAAALERHLEGCAECGTFLAELRESQDRLKRLAGEPLDERALLALRARVRAATREASVGRPAAPYWRWAAAGLFLAALGVVYTWTVRSGRPRPTGVAVQATARDRPATSTPDVAPGRTLVAAPTPAVPAGTRSTMGSVPTVSRNVPSTVSPPADALSPEEADQLARAIVALSRVERLSDAPRTASPAVRAAALVRWATDDPDVVIYWQIDSNGG